jgi:solute:Na+ symporter, SSS family
MLPNSAIDTHGLAIIVAMVVGYMVATSWLTIRFRAKTTSDFMVAARSVPAFVVGVLMVSEFIGPKSTIGAAQVAFESGMAASWAVLSVAIGFPLFGIFLGRKLYSSGEYTISAAIAKKYGRSTQVTVSIIMIYALLLVNVAYYVSGAAALSPVLHLSVPSAAILIAGVSTFYCLIGGLKSAAYVSVLHTTVKYVGVMIVVGVALHMAGGIRPITEHLRPSSIRSLHTAVPFGGQDETEASGRNERSTTSVAISALRPIAAINRLGGEFLELLFEGRACRRDPVSQVGYSTVPAMPVYGHCRR